jgi:hypothetical protein
MDYKPNYDRFPMEILVSVKFRSNWRQIEPNLEQIGSHGRELRGERWGELLRGGLLWGELLRGELLLWGAAAKPLGCWRPVSGRSG